MPSPADPWHALDVELDRWAADGRTARLWLRDDDAVAATPALDRLLDLAGGVAVALAVVPLLAEESLAARLRGRPDVLVCQHGARHVNHAGRNEKPEELGAHRPPAAVLEELAQGRERLRALFGPDTGPAVLVPPWNRIAPAAVAGLPRLGFTALSTSGAPRFAGTIREVNVDLDIMDWKGTRQGHDAAVLVPQLCRLLAAGRARGGRARVGVLSHHLAHGPPAWGFLRTLLARTRARPGVAWAAAGEFVDVLA